MPDTINFGGVSVNDLYKNFLDKGVSKSEASVLVSSWIFENFGNVKRVFNYHEPFPADNPNCLPAPFARHFAHVDWVDGEDIVQAGLSPGERGFNSRFHDIEFDIDALGSRISQAVTCLAEMRRSVHALLDELRAEINRINADVHDSTSQGGKDTSPGFSGLIDFGKYKGTTMFLDKKVSVWQTDKGTIVLPSLETVGVDVVVGPKLNGAAELAKFVANTTEIKQTFPNKVPVDAFAQTYGDHVLSDGRLVKDVLKVLPASGTYDNVAKMIDEISEREASIVRTTVGADVATTAALGLDAGNTAIGTADVARLESIPSNVRVALQRNGIGSVGALAGATAEQVHQIMQSEGLTSTAADSAGWTTYAKTLVRLGPIVPD